VQLRQLHKTGIALIPGSTRAVPAKAVTDRSHDPGDPPRHVASPICPESVLWPSMTFQIPPLSKPALMINHASASVIFPPRMR